MGKICITCKEEKGLSEFIQLRPVRKDGRQLVVGHKDECKECTNSILEDLKAKGLKRCSTCKEAKPLVEFDRRKERKDGRGAKCKLCKGEVGKKYRQKNKEKIADRSKKYRQKNKEKLSAREKELRKENPQRFKDAAKRSRLKNGHKWKEKKRKYNEENRENLNRQKAEWYQKNKENLREKRNEYQRNRRKNDDLYNIRCRITSRLYKCLSSKDIVKSKKTEEVLCIDFEGFKRYIESLFTNGMTWENKGQWHIDHIVPISFAKTEEQVIKLNHYSNLRPLWAKDNLRRGNRVKFNLDIDKHTTKELIEIVLKKERAD
jgi:hypothetical protein